jgi:predicted O-methyltransferase YrrM
MDYRDIPGWFDYEDIYRQAVADAQDGDTLVEVGTWLGRSAAFMAQAIRDSGKRLTFWTIDHHTGSDEPEHRETVDRCGGSTYEAFLQNIAACGLREFVRPLVADSVQAATNFADESLAFVFIDGGHTYEQVSRDIHAWLPKVRPGGTLAGHDAGWDGVQQALNELLPNYRRINSSWAVQRTRNEQRQSITLS